MPALAPSRRPRLGNWYDDRVVLVCDPDGGDAFAFHNLPRLRLPQPVDPNDE
jgi:hypothetical protein